MIAVRHGESESTEQAGTRAVNDRCQVGSKLSMTSSKGEGRSTQTVSEYEQGAPESTCAFEQRHCHTKNHQSLVDTKTTTAAVAT